jgi:two-component system NarL family response regulator
MLKNKKNIITVLIADDHPSTRNGIQSILKKAFDIKVLGEASDGYQTQKMIASLRPDILLLDLKMPNSSPAKLEQWVRINYPETKTLILTAHDRDAYLLDMMEAGAVGYLNKKLQAGQLISAIRRAAHGEVIYDEEQIQRAYQWRLQVRSKLDRLSNREREVLQLLTEGVGNKSIAKSLGITINTVEKHLKSIYRTLGVTSRSEAILWWVEKVTDFRN